MLALKCGSQWANQHLAIMSRTTVHIHVCYIRICTCVCILCDTYYSLVNTCMYLYLTVHVRRQLRKYNSARCMFTACGEEPVSSRSPWSLAGRQCAALCPASHWTSLPSPRLTFEPASEAEHTVAGTEGGRVWKDTHSSLLDTIVNFLYFYFISMCLCYIFIFMYSNFPIDSLLPSSLIFSLSPISLPFIHSSILPPSLPHPLLLLV